MKVVEDVVVNVDRGRYYEDSKNTLTILNQCTTDYIELISLCKSISQLIDNVNNKIDHLNNVECNTIKKEKDIDGLVEKNSMQLEKKIKELVLYFSAVDRYLEILNTNKNSKELSLLYQLMGSNDILKTAADLNVVGLVDNFVSSFKKVAGFSIVTSMFDDINSAVSDKDADIINKYLFKCLDNNILSAGVAASYITLKAILGDEGDLRKEDYIRIGGDAFAGLAEYISTNLITSEAKFLIESGLAGSWAGPIGFAVSAISTAAIESVKNFTIDHITGDYLVYTIIADDGREIPVYANGNGKDGTFDVLLERSENALGTSTYEVDGRTISEQTYKQMLYEIENGWKVIYNSNGHSYPPMDEENVVKIDEFMNAVVEAKDLDEVERIMCYDEPYCWLTKTSDYYQLCMATKFDPIEYYLYHHQELYEKENV